MSIRNVADYGALGTADDTATIQAALNACAPGDVCQFPAGTFDADVLTIPASGITVQGVGATMTILRKIIGGTNEPLLLSSGKSNVIVRWLTLDGQGPSQPYWIENPYDNGNPSDNLRIEGGTLNRVEEVTTARGARGGIYIAGSTQATLTDIAGHDNGFGTLAVYDLSGTRSSGLSVDGFDAYDDYCDSIRIAQSDGSECRNVTIRDVRTIEGAPDQFACVYYEGVDGALLEDAELSGSSNRGVDGNDGSSGGPTAAANNVTVRRARSYGHGRDGAITGGAGWTFDDCDFEDNPDAGIRIRGDGHTVQDCRFRAKAVRQAYGLLLQAATTNLTVTDNDFGGIPTPIDAALPATTGYAASGNVTLLAMPAVPGVIARAKLSWQTPGSNPTLDAYQPRWGDVAATFATSGTGSTLRADYDGNAFHPDASGDSKFYRTPVAAAGQANAFSVDVYYADAAFFYVGWLPNSGGFELLRIDGPTLTLLQGLGGASPNYTHGWATPSSHRVEMRTNGAGVLDTYIDGVKIAALSNVATAPFSYAGALPALAAFNNGHTNSGLLNLNVVALGYAVSGTPAGVAGAASTPVAVTLNAPAVSGDAITITSDNASDVLTASTGTTATGAITVTPAAGATSFTFTVTRTTAGTSTLTFTNGQGWADPAATTYASTIGRRSSRIHLGLGIGL